MGSDTSRLSFAMNRRSLFNFARKDRLIVPEVDPEEDLIDTKHTRRFFFGIFASAVASAVALPQAIGDLSDWTVIIETGPALYAGNQLITAEQLTMETLRILQRNLVMSRMVNRQYQASFDEELRFLEGDQWGESLNVRRPSAFIGAPIQR